MIEVIEGGLLTTVQDRGRFGYQKQGIIVSGAMDDFACRMANILVNNDDSSGVLEMTFVGPRLKFTVDTIIALTGGDLTPQIDGTAAPMWRPLLVRAGSVLSFGLPKKGARTYLAVYGGIQTPAVMGSRSTYLKAALGGLDGRKLQSGDRLPLVNQAAGLELFKSAWRKINASMSKTGWSAAPKYLNNSSDFITIGVTAGPQYEQFSPSVREKFLSEIYTISDNADRMGYRLTGYAVKPVADLEMISDAVTLGTIQIPPDGQPIVLMADRQTAGGYPKLAVVCAGDLSLLAQNMPGGRVKFKLISRREAEEFYLARENYYHMLKQNIKNLLKGE